MSCFGGKRHRSDGSDSDNRKSKRRREDSSGVERGGSDSNEPNSTTASTSGASQLKTAIIWDVRTIPLTDSMPKLVTTVREFVKEELLFGKSVDEFHIVFNRTEFGSKYTDSFNLNTITIHDIRDDVKKSVKEHIIDLVNTFDNKTFNRIVLLGDNKDVSEVILKCQQKGFTINVIHQNKGMKCLKAFVSKDNCFHLKEVYERTKEFDQTKNGHIYDCDPSLKGKDFFESFGAHMTRMMNRDKPYHSNYE